MSLEADDPLFSSKADEATFTQRNPGTKNRDESVEQGILSSADVSLKKNGTSTITGKYDVTTTSNSNLEGKDDQAANNLKLNQQEVGHGNSSYEDDVMNIETTIDVDYTENHLQPSIIKRLPNELLGNVFVHLESPALSTSDRLHDEPSFGLTVSKRADLKSVSMVNWKWRKVALSHLFRHTQIIVSKPLPPNPIFRDGPSLWSFIQRHNLKTFVKTFTLCVYDKKVPSTFGTDEKFRSNDWTRFWTQTFEHLDPSVVTIVASPQVLGSLTCCNVDSSTGLDFDMPYHIFQLKCAPPSPADKPKKPRKHDSKGSRSTRRHVRTKVPVPAPNVPARPSTLFESRPWTTALLNEGSFIKSYKTQLDFASPPSILIDIIGDQEPVSDFASGPSRAMLPQTVRDFSYIATFPNASHFQRFTDKFPWLDRLYVQFVPRNDVLRRRETMKDLEVSDLWQQRNSCYALIMRDLFTAPPPGNFVHLKVFESGDHADKDAWAMAVEFVKRAGTGWHIERTGVFVKYQTEAEGEDDEEDGAGNGFDGANLPSALSVTQNDLA